MATATRPAHAPLFPSPTRLGLISLLTALAAPAAWAATTTLPGANCHADGTVERPTNGGLFNNTPGSTGVVKFHCPIVRSQPVGNTGSTMTISVATKLNLSSASFECVARVTLANGTVYDSADVVMPPKTSSNGGLWTSTFTVILPPFMPASANLRCNVPNLASSEQAGIFFYTVTD